jgi:hypothetical protein
VKLVVESLGPCVHYINNMDLGIVDHTVCVEGGWCVLEIIGGVFATG